MNNCKKQLRDTARNLHMKKKDLLMDRKILEKEKTDHEANRKELNSLYPTFKK